MAQTSCRRELRLGLRFPVAVTVFIFFPMHFVAGYQKNEKVMERKFEVGIYRNIFGIGQLGA